MQSSVPSILRLGARHIPTLFSVLALIGTAGAQDPGKAPEQTISIAPAKPVREVLASSSLWQEKAQEVEGIYRIERMLIDGKAQPSKLTLSADFRTKAGPDLKVVLSPLSVDKVDGKTALKGSIVLGALGSNKGASSYAIPAGVDLSKFQSVLVHCEEYSKLWAAAPLHSGEVLVYGNSWTKKTNKISGAWEIARIGKAHVLRLGADFKTSKAPDLKFVLSPHTLAAAKNGNALEGGIVLASLKAVKGAASYTLPKDFSLKGYQSLLIHCEQYTKLWGGVSLRK